MDHLINHQALSSFKKVVGERFSEFVERFQKNSSMYIQQMNAALQEKDYEALIFAAHKLKSTSGQFGFYKAATICEAIEMNPNMIDATTIDELENTINEVVTECRK